MNERSLVASVILTNLPFSKVNVFLSIVNEDDDAGEECAIGRPELRYVPAIHRRVGG